LSQRLGAAEQRPDLSRLRSLSDSSKLSVELGKFDDFHHLVQTCLCLVDCRRACQTDHVSLPWLHSSLRFERIREISNQLIRRSCSSMLLSGRAFREAFVATPRRHRGCLLGFSDQPISYHGTFALSYNHVFTTCYPVLLASATEGDWRSPPTPDPIGFTRLLKGRNWAGDGCDAI
jgi:hypothetical protein